MNEKDDFQIQLGQSVRRPVEYKKSPVDDRSLCAFPYDQAASEQIPVFVAEQVIRSMESHVVREKDREVGGVLLGRFYRGDKGSFVEITDYIEANAAQATDVSLTFTHETWEQINAEQARRGQETQIVGWYHSHPALGVFMSREDEFIHSSFFADPWQVAMVVDPIYHNWGCFKWREGKLERASGFYVFAEKKAAKRVRELVKTLNAGRWAAPRASSASADRRQAGGPRTAAFMWVIVAALIVSQIVIGYLALAGRQAIHTNLDYYNTAMELLAKSDLSGGAEYLRQEIVANPENDLAYRELNRLHDILSDPALSGFDRNRFDETNLMLAMADKMARGEAKYRERSDFEDIGGRTSGDGEARRVANLEPADPVSKAFKVYSEASVSAEARLLRAKLIKRIADRLFPPPADESARELREETAWYNAAVTWLQEENLRRVAYGIHSGDEGAVKECERLTSKEMARINQIRAGFVKRK